MEHLRSVGYGPVIIEWRYSRVADCDAVVEKLQCTLWSGTQFFGVQERYSDSSQYYVYRMVLWPGLLREDSRFDSTQGEPPSNCQEWRSRLQEVVAELEAIGKKDSLVGFFQGRYRRHPVWDVKSCGDGVDQIHFVKKFVRDVQLHRAISEERAVFFGCIAFEYSTDGQRWREEYSGSAEGRYVGSVERVAF